MLSLRKSTLKDLYFASSQTLFFTGVIDMLSQNIPCMLLQAVACDALCLCLKYCTMYTKNINLGPKLKQQFFFTRSHHFIFM
jgi:hypothetical protein